MHTGITRKNNQNHLLSKLQELLTQNRRKNDRFKVFSIHKHLKTSTITPITSIDIDTTKLKNVCQFACFPSPPVLSKA